MLIKREKIHLVLKNGCLEEDKVLKYNIAEVFESGYIYTRNYGLETYQTDRLGFPWNRSAYQLSLPPNRMTIVSGTTSGKSM